MVGRPLPGWASWVLVGVWLVASAGGLTVLIDYESTPSLPAEGPATWPATSQLTPPKGRPLLLYFVHPHCPCTRASTAELAKLLARATLRPRIEAIVLVPEGRTEAWARTDIYEAALDLPDTTARFDHLGEETTRFGVETSGQVLLYSPQGELLFAGGVTASRGHHGDNNGAAAVIALLGGETPPLSATAVYGCGLNDQDCLEDPLAPIVSATDVGGAE